MTSKQYMDEMIGVSVLYIASVDLTSKIVFPFLLLFLKITIPTTKAVLRIKFFLSSQIIIGTQSAVKIPIGKFFWLVIIASAFCFNLNVFFNQVRALK